MLSYQNHLRFHNLCWENFKWKTKFWKGSSWERSNWNPDAEKNVQTDSKNLNPQESEVFSAINYSCCQNKFQSKSDLEKHTKEKHRAKLKQLLKSKLEKIKKELVSEKFKLYVKLANWKKRKVRKIILVNEEIWQSFTFKTQLEDWQNIKKNGWWKVSFLCYLWEMLSQKMEIENAL